MNTAGTRYHSLDALRATALLLGVLLHGALAYMPVPDTGWALQDANTNPGFAVFVFLVHSFRLEAFFLLAGFFARLTYLRLGAPGFLRNRLRRILVPFALGWLLVFPLLVFGWTWARMNADPSAVGAALRIGYTQTWGHLSGAPDARGFSLTHLWFLYYLLLVYLVFLAARGLLLRFPRAASAWRARADAGARFLFGRMWGLPVLALATGAILMGMKTWGVDTPDKTFAPHGAALSLYALVFGLGWLLHRQADLLDRVRQRWGLYLAVALVSALVVLAAVGKQIAAGTAPLWWFQTLYALQMWAWILALTAVFLRFCSRESAPWRYLADSSYWVYIIHLPAVVALQVALSRYALGSGAKFAMVCFGAAAFSLITYHFLVRSTPVGQLLNGRRLPLRPGLR